MGARLLAAFQVMASDYEMVREVRGKGLMIGIEFGRPRSLKLQAAWGLLEAVSTGLFCQLITIPLCTRHRILAQVAGHASHTVKLLPALVISASSVARMPVAPHGDPGRRLAVGSLRRAVRSASACQGSVSAT